MVDIFLWESSSNGGTGGSPFTDFVALGTDNQTPIIQAGSSASHLIVRSQARIDSVQLGLSTGQLPAHGGSGGVEQSVNLTGDHITSATVWVDNYRGNDMLFGLRIVTRNGHVYDFGKQTGTESTAVLPDGYQGVGFFGRSAVNVDQLGLIASRIQG